MLRNSFKPLRTPLAVCLTAAFAAWGPAADARVTKIIIDRPATPLTGDATYETITGRAFGELDPMDAHNALITDITAAPRNGNGMVEYVATFFIVKPVDMTKSSGLMWHDVPNRGGRITISSDLRAQGDIGISSAWQGDNAGATVVPADASSPTPVTPSANEWVKTPVLTGTTGGILGRIINKPSGTTPPNNNPTNQPLNVMGNPIPYFPANSADNSDALLKVHLSETINGVITEGETIPNSDWKFCYGSTATFAAPGLPTALPVRVCLGNGRSFDPAKLYQLTYTVKDPYVLGAGTAAFRDVGSFFRYAAADDAGTANPLAGSINKAIIRGSSQSGNFTRHLIFLGMNEDEAGRIVHEGAWPLIAGRRVANNSRWGQPDGVLELYQMGSEGPQWWHKYPDRVRDLPPGGILDRCSLSETCPKVIETFGGAEVFALKMTPSWVGTDPKNDIPLPDNVRRYYLPSSTHGGGGGGFNEATNPQGASCPGNNWGVGTLRANPVPATALVNRMRVALREWVMDGTPPPPSKWPLMRGPKGERTLVEANKAAMGFPSGVPGIPDSIFLPENFAFPIFDYDWGPDFDHFNATGNPTNVPPPIKAVVKTMVPKVDSDGNELGGVPTVLRDAPLGTYLGWNITSGPGDPFYDGRPFHAGQVCNYVGGMVPFFKKKADRLAAGDPRLSLEERYNNSHAGYVAAVKAAADNAACQGYLLAAGPASDGSMPKCQTTIPAGFPDDWAVLVNQAIASNVCNQPGDGGKCNPAAP
jgi:alpha/beta hydrolase family protein